MNNPKKTLLMVSGILSLIEGAGLILLTAFLGSFLNAIIDTVVATDPALTEQDIELIREQFQLMQGAFQVILAIFAVIVVLAGIFTLIAVSDPNKFERRKGLQFSQVRFRFLLSFTISVLVCQMLQKTSNQNSQPLRCKRTKQKIMPH